MRLKQVGIRRHLGWLGWAVAAVLALSAGGVALADRGSGPVGTSAAAAAATTPSPAIHPRHGGLLWRVLHGTITVQTRFGPKTITLARGVVASDNGKVLVVRSTDGTTTAFSLSARTRYGSRRAPGTAASIRPGERVLAVGVWHGRSLVARRVASLPLLPAPAGTATGAASTPA